VLLGKEEIFAANDIKSERVLVPEWGGEVMVRGLSGRARDEWEASMLVQRGKTRVQDLADLRARLVVRCVVDEAGDLVFTPGDLDAVSGKSGAALNRVFEVAAKLSGISDDDVEEMTEDFGSTAGRDSSSG
jgi:hypothetical protein